VNVCNKRWEHPEKWASPPPRLRQTLNYLRAKEGP